ncbi:MULTISPECIES: glutathione peroxidase [Cohnella]|uniref:glutathione peroxidase n=1 Tax=Cohnella TaxID=329857 RepID=UPI0009BBE1C6|nr:MULTISPECIES: glutathione peroxidase [Cohnella]MBN2981336.1 glutathione peroxidase [Cohnella algarum]
MSVYRFRASLIDGKEIELSAYRGKALLIVNIGSKCSYSRQLTGLQKLYERRREQGFEILGFPCNQFNGKEPGSHSEIRDYCERNFGVTFPLFEKTDVRGPSAHPLFQYLTEQAPFKGFDAGSAEGRKMRDFLMENDPDIYAGDGVKWNFSKFLVGRDGEVKGRFETTVEPPDIEKEIEELLFN